MNKTDAEIIKGLECCVNTEFISDCAKCEMFAFDCKDILIEKSLDYLHRLKAKEKEQQAEIERLQNDVAIARKETKRYKSYRNDFVNANKIAKSEAIREFAERLKAVSHPYADTQMVFELQIDNLVKEMTENDFKE